ncbi:MAG: DUF6502 family protein [Burkholderiaceae bacterium]
MEGSAQALNEALRRNVLRVLKALAKLMIRHGVSVPSFVELAKQAYVDVALREFAIPGRKPSVSRASLLTGLTRKEVQRLAQAEPAAGAEAIEAHHRAARVVAGWVRDEAFLEPGGQPLALPFDGGEASFAELVRRYGGDVTPRAVLDELLRVGTVQREADGRIRLLTRVYIPRTSDVGKLNIFGSNVAYLIETIDHNIVGSGTPRFQRTVVYDNLPREAAAEFRAVSSEQAQALIERLDRWLAQHDRDTNPLARGSGRVRAGMGIFYFEQDFDQPAGNPK